MAERDRQFIVQLTGDERAAWDEAARAAGYGRTARLVREVVNAHTGDRSRPQRPDVDKPVLQMSLRAAPEDARLDDAQWADIAQVMAEQMGWAEHPWLVVRHADDHVHVVVSRVDEEGQLWWRSGDRWRAQRACREIEQTYGLTPVSSHSSEQSKRTADHTG